MNNIFEPGPNPFFEGAEKSLEIWFIAEDDSVLHDLRQVPKHKYKSMLRSVNCEIISFSSNDKIDAYVLSESSMFISERCFILKTCGTTTPLQCIPLLSTLVAKYSQMTVEKVYYSRKNFENPQCQTELYRKFDSEIAYVKSCFESNGVAYCVKCGNEEDCWYLFTLYPNAKLGVASDGYLEVESSRVSPPQPDQCLEILMSDLEPRVMSLFSQRVCFSAKEATRRSGIADLVPSMLIDDYLFHPYGYSMNGISSSGTYVTIHVTPQPECSYVSFETNVAQISYADLIKRVVDTFHPGKFIVALFTNDASLGKDAPIELTSLKRICDQWTQQSCRLCQLRNYDLTVAFYSKFLR